VESVKDEKVLRREGFVFLAQLKSGRDMEEQVFWKR